MNVDELDKLIEFIYNKHDIISKDWKKDKRYKPINMKKIQVADVVLNNELLDIIYDYRNFISNYYTDLLNDISLLKLNNQVELRIKAYSSLQDKINRYYAEKKHEYGKISINKCVNDILGIRLIFNEAKNLQEVMNYINKKYNNLKSIDSSKDGYVATHVYFMKNDNLKFQWELQLWNKKDVENNKECHEKYKQEYTKFENTSEVDDRNV